MTELSRQGMVKANLAAIEVTKVGGSYADMVRAGVEAYLEATREQEAVDDEPCVCGSGFTCMARHDV